MSERRTMLRIEGFLTIVIMLLIIALGVLAYAIPPDELIINPVFKTRTELFLTTAIGLFALVEGVSAALQLRDNRKRDKIVDLRNELEKAYGPLYSIFNPNALDQNGIFDNEGELIEVLNTININKSEKEKLNFILSTYPFMFKPEIFNYWREHLQYQYVRNISDERMFPIRVEFIQMIYDEYHQRLETYNNLLGRVQR